MEVWVLLHREIWEDSFYLKDVFDSEEKAKAEEKALIREGSQPVDVTIEKRQVK